MLKRLGFVLGLAAMLAAVWLLARQLVFENGETTRESPAGSVAPANGTQPPVEDAPLALALKTIDLTQGEGGFEIWRLKAEWANILKEGDSILVQKPRLTYFSKDNGEPLYVSSESGDIHQKSQILRFHNNVRIIQEDKVLDGDMLVYNGTQKTMTFPRGGIFTGTGLSGTAGYLVWNINNNTIVATGDIRVLMEGGAPDSGPGSLPSGDDATP